MNLAKGTLPFLILYPVQTIQLRFQQLHKERPDPSIKGRHLPV